MGDGYMKYIAEMDFLDGYCEMMPAGWMYEYVSYCNRDAYRFRPYFVIDFVNYNVECEDVGKSKKSKKARDYATLRLEFHNRRWHPDILEQITVDRKKGENIPRFFDETKGYVILRSADSFCGDGAGMSESQYKDLEKSLRRYCIRLRWAEWLEEVRTLVE